MHCPRRCLRKPLQHMQKTECSGRPKRPFYGHDAKVFVVLNLIKANNFMKVQSGHLQAPNALPDTPCQTFFIHHGGPAATTLHEHDLERL